MDATRVRLEASHTGAVATGAGTPAEVPRDWREELPVLTGPNVTVRELRAGDAAALFAMITSPDVTQFISPPPPDVDGLERFIECGMRDREGGNGFCMAIVPKGMDVAVGLIQLRRLEPRFEVAEWGFAIGSAFWGTGVFTEAAQLALEFAFDTIGVHRLEARATARNGRGNGVLRKLGAVQEGVLRRAFKRGGRYFDQVLWSILADEWFAGAERFPAKVH
jgi:ribosomal-protein-alanine N-acetyltransferase